MNDVTIVGSEVISDNQESSNGFARTSLILGLLGLCCFSLFTGLPAIICGIIAFNKKQSKGMAIIGIFTGALSTFTGIFIIFIMTLLSLFSN